MNDGNGGSAAVTKTIKVTAVNDPPTLADIPDMTVVAGSGSHVVPLTGITAGGGESQTLSISASSDNLLLVQIVTPYGYTSPNNSGTLTINATGVGADAVTISVTVQDTDTTAHGGSKSITKTFHVTVMPPPTGGANIKPTIVLSPFQPSYTENSPPVTLDNHDNPNGVDVTDPDSPDFKDGVLTVSFAAGGLPEDRLGILNQGNGAGQIGVSGPQSSPQISYGGTVFGAVSGGYVASPLKITFINTYSSHEAVRALLKAITYWNTSENPVATQRTVQFQMTDGDGGRSDPVTKTLSIIRVNDRPVANPQSVKIFKNTAKPITLTGFDPDADALTFSIVSAPLASQGTLSGTPPNITFTPLANYIGPSSFTFKVNDGTIDSLPATVTISVVPRNQITVDAGPD